MLRWIQVEPGDDLAAHRPGAVEDHHGAEPTPVGTMTLRRFVPQTASNPPATIPHDAAFCTVSPRCYPRAEQG
jgi:hypothetical protein